MEKYSYDDIFGGDEDSEGTIYHDLDNLATLLNQNEIVGNTAPITACARRRGSNNEYWHHHIDGLVFNKDNSIKATGGTLPHGVDCIELTLTINVKGRYCNRSNIMHIQDPLINVNETTPYSCDIVLKGLDETIEGVYSCWHFDRHGFDEESNYIHPIYHWTYGGNSLESPEEGVFIDLGNSFILPTPRIGHPPFDAILMIDYIIRNYIHKDIHLRLTEDSKYIEIVRRSQYRLWRPYQIRAAAHWLKLDNHGYTFDDNFSLDKVVPELYH